MGPPHDLGKMRLGYGGGTYASRTAMLGGSAAAMAADKVVGQGQEDRGARAGGGRGRHRIRRRDIPRRRHRPGGLIKGGRAGRLCAVTPAGRARNRAL